MNKWEMVESFEPSYLDRMKKMAEFIPPGVAILDLGCGPMWLKSLLPAGCSYYPVDFIRRGDDTIVCDFNQRQFPAIRADCAFCSGILEYVLDIPWFAGEIAGHANCCVMSYNTLESAPNLKARSSLGWVNALARNEILSIFANCGMELAKEPVFPGIDPIFVMEKRV